MVFGKVITLLQEGRAWCSEELTVFFVALAGSSRHPVLRGSLCVHHIWWLRSLLWGCVHTDPSCYHHSCGNAAVHYWTHWLLRYHPGESLWAGYGKCRAWPAVCLPAFSLHKLLKYSLNPFLCGLKSFLLHFLRNILFQFSVLNKGVKWNSSSSRRCLCFTSFRTLVISFKNVKPYD